MIKNKTGGAVAYRVYDFVAVGSPPVTSLSGFTIGTGSIPGVTVPIIERTILILVLVVVIRFVCERMGARSSYLACVDVKRILREKIYEKMLKLGASYSEQVSSSEVVQVSTEGVEHGNIENIFHNYFTA